MDKSGFIKHIGHHLKLNYFQNKGDKHQKYGQKKVWDNHDDMDSQQDDEAGQAEHTAEDQRQNLGRNCRPV